MDEDNQVLLALYLRSVEVVQSLKSQRRHFTGLLINSFLTEVVGSNQPEFSLESI